MAKTINIIYLYLLLCLLSACANHKTASVPAPPDSTITVQDRYEPASGALKEIYLDAKWRYYCSFCDSPMRLKGGRNFTCGEFEVRPGWRRDSSSTIIGRDSRNVAVYLGFYYHDTLIDELRYLKSTQLDYSNYFDGLVYGHNNYKLPRMVIFGIGFHPLFYGDTIDAYRQRAYGKFRLINPLQPEVIYYIRENARRIHPWFLREAKRRGVFDSVRYPPVEIEMLMNINKRDTNAVTDWVMFIGG